MTHTEILANLEEIENVARLACREAYENRKYIVGAINWGDFGVSDVRYVFSALHKEEGFEVIITEASDYQPYLEQWMREFFLYRGYKNPPEFRFEW